MGRFIISFLGNVKRSHLKKKTKKINNSANLLKYYKNKKEIIFSVPSTFLPFNRLKRILLNLKSETFFFTFLFERDKHG